MDKIQITISNKVTISGQIRITSQIVLQELIPDANQLQAELQKFQNLGNSSNIETMNKQLDKLQKYFRLRTELLALLSSVASCCQMSQDIMRIYQLFGDPNYNEETSQILKKIKIYQKVAKISLQ